MFDKLAEGQCVYSSGCKQQKNKGQNAITDKNIPILNSQVYRRILCFSHFKLCPERGSKPSGKSIKQGDKARKSINQGRNAFIDNNVSFL